MKNPSTKWIAGFWRRSLASIPDALVLGGVGMLLGSLFEDQFMRLGPSARLIGFVITMAYFGILESRIGNGQTIGKRLFSIRVVDAQNAPLTVKRSLIRQSIFQVPFYLGTLLILAIPSNTIFQLATSLIHVAFFVTILYLYTFNRNTRQTFYDIVTESFVVNSNHQVEVLPPIWKGHWITAGVLSLLIIVTGILLRPSDLIHNYDDLHRAYTAINNHDLVHHANLTYGHRNTNTGETFTFTNANIYLKTTQIDDRALAEKFAKLIVELYPDSKNKEVLAIVFLSGYDIGIASKQSHEAHTFRPQDLAVE